MCRPRRPHEPVVRHLLCAFEEINSQSTDCDYTYTRPEYLVTVTLAASHKTSKVFTIIPKQIVLWICKSFLQALHSTGNICNAPYDTPASSITEPIGSDVWRSLMHDHWMFPIGTRMLKNIPNIENAEMLDAYAVFLGRPRY